VHWPPNRRRSSDRVSDLVEAGGARKSRPCLLGHPNLIYRLSLYAPQLGQLAYNFYRPRHRRAHTGRQQS